MELPNITFDDAPRVIFWEATKACDLGCNHCRARSNPDRDSGELDTEEVKDMLSKLQTDGRISFIVTGGDPLRRPDISQVIEFATELGFSSHVALSSARTVSKRNLEEMMESGMTGIALSLDGSRAKFHDKFRGNSGSFEKTIELARTCEELGVSLQINTTVTKETMGDLPGILSLVEDLGVSRWSLFFLVPTGRGSEMVGPSGKRIEALLNWLSEVSKRKSMSVNTTEAHHYRRVRIQRLLDSGLELDEVLGRKDSTRSKIEGLGIHDGNGVMFVSHLGDVHPSGFLPLKAGSVKEDDPLMVYRNSGLFKELRDISFRKGKCGHCEYLGVCGGSRAQAYAASGDYLASDPNCIYQPGGADDKISKLSGKKN
ncbi:TIGR04053 family radical SAM/SPASM domain-containing protein [Candidatus Bipolaricaulota bacterium]|nr:TIGR04053 family radical SAM/SPASM domain-containing protein [Candidatus Bipolaricaulota bacterium]MBS3792822.1 TIGR04053 family radical SAM/SPASM domain-containing protein [Candidatus Bipolaricaulota bacterium]